MEKRAAVDDVYWQSLPVGCYATRFWLKRALSFVTTGEVYRNGKLR